jgi:hypothetical protein
MRIFGNLFEGKGEKTFDTKDTEEEHRGTAVQCAEITESGLSGNYYTSLASGGTGVTKYTPDTRIPNVFSLPAGPFQLTPGVPYTSYAESPVHRVARAVGAATDFDRVARPQLIQLKKASGARDVRRRLFLWKSRRLSGRRRRFAKGPCSRGPFCRRKERG